METSPLGAQASLGAVSCTTPCTLRPSPNGPQSVTISLDGYAATRIRLTNDPAPRDFVDFASNATITQSSGKISVDLSPPCAAPPLVPGAPCGGGAEPHPIYRPPPEFQQPPSDPLGRLPR
ncbi:MAG: PEGA domain-containing protein [Caulobacterales bacterium]|nr:PEGA domain-containing protein [Caulobacterales bacterium]